MNHKAQMPCRPHGVTASPFIPIYDTLDISSPGSESTRSVHSSKPHGISMLLLHV